ncbi:MAG: addiction module protein [Acidobacteria bacterium]|nr:addiction module protein [Acidobacteriota bacterium]
MNATLKSIEEAANLLSVRERAALAHNLLKGLDDADEDESYIESLWAKESEERLDAYLRGEIEASPFEDAVERVKARIRK